MTALAGAKIIFLSHGDRLARRRERGIRRQPALGLGDHDAQPRDRQRCVRRRCRTASASKGASSSGARRSFADPNGNVLARASHDAEETLIVECDLSRIDVVRTHWPFLRDRRIDAYGDLTRRISGLAAAGHHGRFACSPHATAPSGHVPAAAGYRMPAEWEPHAAPGSPGRTSSTWPGKFEPIPPLYARLVRELAVRAGEHPGRRRSAMAQAQVLVGDVPNVTLHDIPTNDAWIRDNGPTFLTGLARRTAGTGRLGLQRLGRQVSAL